MSDHVRHQDERERPSRSRSPGRENRPSYRTRSPHHHHHRRKKTSVTADAPKDLPYGSRQLTKRDYSVFKPMFALYLDIQKQKILDGMDETEAKGRWKSFIGKWNCGELSEGWYDPSTLQKAVTSSQEYFNDSRDHISERDQPPAVRHQIRTEQRPRASYVEPDSDSDDSVGPELPGVERHLRKRVGPSIPNVQDLELKREMDAEDGLARRDDIRFDRKMDRKLQKEALDELVPRAEAGTRERQLEKKKEVNEKMKSFREKSPGAEVPDTELMGGGDSLSEFEQKKQEFERKKNERELRKEEVLRARAAEREERMAEYKLKEDNTMAMLKALAKQNFG